ncbi:hypothetical protein R3P38DRAFT_971191 [Favolaschia claudopus]|uniref:Uncharacterized protein n=1 Tax=Favolaschia claudopus TaxID=2862362 RepID=A0AAW0E7A9_9AGAR
MSSKSMAGTCNTPPDLGSLIASILLHPVLRRIVLIIATGLNPDPGIYCGNQCRGTGRARGRGRAGVCPSLAVVGAATMGGAAAAVGVAAVSGGVVAVVGAASSFCPYEHKKMRCLRTSVVGTSGASEETSALRAASSWALKAASMAMRWSSSPSLKWGSIRRWITPGWLWIRCHISA